jgi:endo-1,4-beta-xylanase
MQFRRIALFILFTLPLFAQSLRDLAEPRRILMGAAHNGSFSDATYLATMAREYNQLQPENDMKFSPLHPSPDVFTWSRADAIVNYAAQNGMRVRGHVLVWHSQLPGWVTNGRFTPAQLSDVLHQHILAVAGRYQGKVYGWDVVNEAFNDDGSLRDTIWYDQPGIGLPGTAYIEQAFRWAREADPNALLFYNDYSAESVNAKSDAIYKMAADFKTRGVPISGIGLQAHFTTGNLGNLAGIDANIQRITGLGLQVQITELDVRLPLDSSGNATAANLASQADLYGKLAAICFKYPLCTGFQTWGFTDKSSWIPGFYPGFGAALPFDANFQPKPADTALQSALNAAPDLPRPPLPAPAPRPQISAAGLVNAANYVANGVSPGEIIVLFGPTQGPPALVAAQAGANGKLATSLAETRLLFDGVAAPLLYSVAGQISSIVPFGVAGKQQTAVQYEYQGIQSNVVTATVVASKPGLFTLDASGKGQAAALDAAYNPVTRASPIAKSGVVLLFLTGAGQTNPPGVDGLITAQAPLPAVANVTATIGGIEAPVQYAGGAVGLVQGGIQVNAQVPAAVSSGDQPVVITIGGVASSAQVTIAVR